MSDTPNSTDGNKSQVYIDHEELKSLCLEYSQLCTLEEGRTSPTPAKMIRMREIQATLGMDHDEILMAPAKGFRREYDPC